MKDVPDIEIGDHSGYEPDENTIWVSGTSCEDVVRSIMHELNHWSQFLYLNPDEENMVINIYNNERKNHRIPFLERIII